MEHSEEISGAFLKACCQPAHIFHLAKEAFDEISLGVEDFIVWDRIALVTFRGNDGERPFKSSLQECGSGVCQHDLGVEHNIFV